MWSLPPGSAPSLIPFLHFSVQTPFPIPMGDLHQIRVQGHGTERSPRTISAVCLARKSGEETIRVNSKSARRDANASA